ncbi:MAG: hypothetical protein ACFUZC_08255 [Chthoniobacteraceae bacterium]
MKRAFLVSLALIASFIPPLWAGSPASIQSVAPPALKWSAQAAVSPDVKPQADAWKEVKEFVLDPKVFLGEPTDHLWYRTVIPLPDEAAERSLWLRFQHVRGIGRVYVNGVFLKELVRPDLEVNITPALEKGSKEAELLVYVTRTGLGTDAKMNDDRIMSPVLNQRYKVEHPHSAGLMGRVDLLLRGERSWIDSAWVESIWEPKTLRVHVKTGGAADPILKVSGQVLDAKGKVALELPAAPFQSGTVALSATWPNVVPWELDRGVLYSLRLQLVGKEKQVTDSLAPISFGFRELKIQGKQFIMNGHPVTWRFSPITRIDTIKRKTGDYYSAEPPVFDFLRSVGFNVVEVQPNGDSFWNPGGGAWNAYSDERLDEADRHGTGISISVPQFTNHWFDYGVSSDPEVVAQYRRELEAFMAPYRNHPSIITWVGAMNYFDHDYGAIANTPKGMGQEAYPQQKSRPHYQLIEKGCRLIEQIDPTRPAYAHHGGNAGPISTSNQYLGFTPLAEVERWPSHWAAHGTKPWLAIEFGVPYWADFWMKNRDEKTGQLKPFGEAAITEFAAGILGDEAYALEDEAQRLNLGTLTQENIHGHGSERIPQPPELRLEGNILGLPAVRRVYAECGYRINRAWRTWQVTGWSPWLLSWGLRFRGSPEEAEPEVVKAYRESEQPLLAYIGGAPEFYLRNRNFQAGEKIQKTAVFVWDGPGSYELNAKWQATMKGKPIASGEWHQTLAPGTVHKLPFEFKAPTVETKAAIDLTLYVNSGQKGEVTDRMDLSLWPSPLAPKLSPKIARPVYLFDPASESKWVSQSVPQAKVVAEVSAFPSAWKDAVLILGRRSLHSLKELPYTAADVAQGLRVILLEQEQADLFRLGLRSVERGTRQGISTFPGNPAVLGMEEADFRDWRGSSTLLPEEDSLRWWADLEKLDAWQPARGARWGCHGSVASVLIETPHKGSFRPLLRCGFDQAYTPLLEWRNGAGGVWFCQLDLTGRVGVEPAATKVAGNLLAYVAENLPWGSRDLFFDSLPGKELESFKNLGFKIADQPTPTTLRIGTEASPEAGSSLRMPLPSSPASGISWKTAAAIASAEIELPAGDHLPPNLQRFRLPVPMVVSETEKKIVRLKKTGEKVEGFIGIPLSAADGPYIDAIARDHARLSRWRLRQLYGWVLTAAGVRSNPEVEARITSLSLPAKSATAEATTDEPHPYSITDMKISQSLSIPELKGAKLLTASALPILEFKDQKVLSANHDVLSYGGDKVEGVYIDLAKLLDVKPSESRIAVIKAHIRVTKEQRLTIRFGADYYGTVSLNGRELIHLDAQAAPPHRDAFRSKGDFHEGANELEIRVVSGSGGFGCWIDVDDAPNLQPLRAAGNEIGIEPYWGRAMLPYNPEGFSLYCEPMRKRDDPYAWLSW